MEINTNKLKYQDNDVVQLGEKIDKFAKVKQTIIQQLKSITNSVNQNLANSITNCLRNNPIPQPKAPLHSQQARQELNKLLTEGIDYQI